MVSFSPSSGDTLRKHFFPLASIVIWLKIHVEVPEDYGIYLHFKEKKKRGIEELLINFKDIGSFFSCPFYEGWKDKYRTYY